jgi:hypothetical protein
MPGEEEELVEAASPAFSEKRFQKRRAADVEQRLGRRLCPFAKAGPKPADKDCALKPQDASLRNLRGQRRPAFVRSVRLRRRPTFGALERQLGGAGLTARKALSALINR